MPRRASQLRSRSKGLTAPGILLHYLTPRFIHQALPIMNQINRRKPIQLVVRVPVEKQLDIARVAADGERGEVLVGESADEFHP